MNCKAGDLAIIVRIPEQWLALATPETRKLVIRLIGTIVRCVRLGKPNISGHPTWVLERPVMLNDHVLAELEDLVLTPIRGGNIDTEQDNELEVV